MFRRLLAFFIGIATTTGSVARSDDIPPQFPRVSGDFEMTETWWVTLPGEFAERYEKSELGIDLVLWRKGMTCWTTAYKMKAGETPASTLKWVKEDRSKDAIEEIELTDAKPLRYAYVLHESPKDEPERWALYSFAFGESGHIMMAIYYDREADLDTAKKIWMSIAEKKIAP